MGLLVRSGPGSTEGGRPKTGETHRYATMIEFDPQTTAELARYAVQHRIVSLE